MHRPYKNIMSPAQANSGSGIKVQIMTTK